MDGNTPLYPAVKVSLSKLKDNLIQLKRICAQSGIQIAGVVKGFTAIPAIAAVYDEVGFDYIASSRLEQLAPLKKQSFKTPLLHIRIAMPSEIKELVKIADASLQSEISTIRLIDEESKRQGKTHGIILMCDLGDLREGYWDKDELVDVSYIIEKELTSVKLLGVGVNLGCYGSVAATPEKLSELVEAAKRIESKIGRKLDIISGGASTSVDTLLKGDMPERINQLRLGEIAVLGGIYGCDAPFLHKDVFTLTTEIIEIKDKPTYPVGKLSVDAFGKVREYVDRGIRKRALTACGRVDYGDSEDLKPIEKGISVLGASSDHTILDIEDAENDSKIGDTISFNLSYGNLVYLTNTPSVRIEIVD